jgi:predicted amidohydrolase YtcJ
MYALAGVKLFADGALGSRGAALLEPYSDRPGHSGLMQQSPAVLRKLVDKALAGGFQVATHAIGDAANRAVLDVYIAAMKAARVRDPRLRIEHCQIVHPDDIPRFAEHGVIASMQPTHATSDMPWVPDRIGPDRLAGAYAWRSFLEAGAHLCFGSDFPVELVDVTHGLHAALTRQDAEGKPTGGWLPEQRVTLREALAGFATEAAYAVHREDHLGRIAVGYRGDLTCFEGPLLKMKPSELRDAKILGTVVDGQAQYWA